MTTHVSQFNSRPCPGCGAGIDTDGDGNCSSCSVAKRIMDDQVDRQQQAGVAHLQAIARAIQDCNCSACVEHLIHEVLLYAAALPLVVKPTEPSEHGRAAHLRNNIRATAKGWRE
jgi:hypothetical protein